MKKTIALLLLALTVGCTQSPLTTTPVATPVDPNSLIGKTDEYGVVIKVDIPQTELCTKDKVEISQQVFEQCVVNGLTRVQVANALRSYEGKILAESGEFQTVQWEGKKYGDYWTVMASFQGGYLVTKSASGLPYEP